MTTIGICTRYGRHEATAVALRIAQWTQRVGRDLSIFSMSRKRVSVDPRWDHRVVYNKDEFLMTDWIEQCDYVVWTTVPHPAQIHWAKQQGKKAIIVVLWHYLGPQDVESLLIADHVVAPHAACFAYLQHIGCANIVYCQWDCGHPVFAKPLDHNIQPRVLVPLWDGNARRTEMTLLDLVARATHRHPDAQFTIAYSNSTLRPRVVQRFKELQRCYPNQIEMVCRIPPMERSIMFQKHDLTLWTTHFESLNLTGLMSIAAGTPIMAFNFSPTDEILTESNSVTVQPDGVMLNNYGLPKVQPNYELMDQLLHDALSDRDYLRQLQQTVNVATLEHRNRFNQQLGHCFS